MRPRVRPAARAFDPAFAFARPATVAVFVFGLARPHPRIQHTQRLTIHSDSVGGMKVHATLRFVAQRAQALDGKPVFTPIEEGLVLRVMGHLSAADIKTLREVVGDAIW